MKRHVSMIVALALVLATMTPVLAGEKEVTLTGWVTDEWCGKANANAKGKGCTLSCAKSGAQLVLFSGEKLYKLSDQEEAKKHVGYEVVVTGTIADDGTVKVTKFEKKKAEKA